MKKRKLKKFVLPTIYALTIIASFFSVSLLNNILLKEDDNIHYSESILQDVTESVMSEKEDKILLPYVSNEVKSIVTYYNSNDDVEKQQNSLIYYKNTYMPSSGVIYGSETTFDVIAVYDGNVKNITQDEILGTVVEISHNDNLTTIYYSLTNVNLVIGDSIKAGAVLGQADVNDIYPHLYTLLFEVYYQGKSINPDVFYTMKIDELQ